MELGARQESLRGSFCFVEDPVKPMLSALGPCRTTSFVHSDGTVGYIEDEGVWFSGAEQRVLRPWVGQTGFLAAQSDDSDTPIVAHLRN